MHVFAIQPHQEPVMEASTIGLPAGQWPQALQVAYNGRTITIQKDHQLEDGGWQYGNDEVGIYIDILND